MKKLAVYAKKYKIECILGPLFKLLEASFELIVPLIMAAIIDRGIAIGDNHFILNMGLVLALLAAVGLASSVTAQFFAAKAAIGICSDLRKALLAKIQTFSYTMLDAVGTSKMLTRMTSDVNQVQTGINLSLRLLLRSPFVVFGAMITAFTIDTKCALIFLIVIIILCAVVFTILLSTLPKYTDVQAELDGVTAAARENLKGVRVLRAFMREDSETAEFLLRSKRLMRVQNAVGRLSALLNPLTLVIINAAVIALILTGAVRVNIGGLTQGEVVALYNLMSLILVELIKMANLIITVTKSVACASRVESVLDMNEEDDGSTEKGKTAVASLIGNYQNDMCDFTGELLEEWQEKRIPKVDFQNVSYSYKGSSTHAIENISFSAFQGEMIGIIGGTGSGKTTLANLIPGFYAATEGAVLIDGINVRDYEKGELMGRMGIVPQKSVLFSGTIRSNMLMGNKNATDDEIRSALSIAQADEIVRNRPLGLDEPVAQMGANYSGGQRQRLAIARALVRRPDILILDDSASALDFATDARLREAIRRIDKPPTTFIISQRTASVRYADRIIVMDDGRAVGIGAHDELLKSCAIYREIYYSQFPEEAR